MKYLAILFILNTYPVVKSISNGVSTFTNRTQWELMDTREFATEAACERYIELIKEETKQPDSSTKRFKYYVPETGTYTRGETIYKHIVKGSCEGFLTTDYYENLGVETKGFPTTPAEMRAMGYRYGDIQP